MRPEARNAVCPFQSTFQPPAPRNPGSAFPRLRITPVGIIVMIVTRDAERRTVPSLAPKDSVCEITSGGRVGTTDSPKCVNRSQSHSRSAGTQCRVRDPSCLRLSASPDSSLSPAH